MYREVRDRTAEVGRARIAEIEYIHQGLSVHQTIIEEKRTMISSDALQSFGFVYTYTQTWPNTPSVASSFGGTLWKFLVEIPEIQSICLLFSTLSDRAFDHREGDLC